MARHVADEMPGTVGRRDHAPVVQARRLAVIMRGHGPTRARERRADELCSGNVHRQAAPKERRPCIENAQTVRFDRDADIARRNTDRQTAGKKTANRRARQDIEHVAKRPPRLGFKAFQEIGGEQSSIAAA